MMVITWRGEKVNIDGPPENAAPMEWPLVAHTGQWHSMSAESVHVTTLIKSSGSSESDGSVNT